MLVERKAADEAATSCNIRLPTSGGLYAWEFERDGRSVNVQVAGPFVLNDMHLLIDAALHGAGLAIVMEDMAAPFIADGRLVRVLEDWSPPFSEYVGQAHGRSLPAI
jgi:DNA-binding transcriptional LysR family regulator